MRYSDVDLAEAIAASRSWRGTLRHLGLTATSAGSMRAARRRADLLGLSYEHFTGQRTWSDNELAVAIGRSRSWTQVLRHLGLGHSAYSVNALRAHAERLAVDCNHLSERARVPDERFPVCGEPDLLRSAAGSLAAAWFQLRGCSVSWPLEPARYDLLVELSGAISRVQVKTTVATASTSGAVSLSVSRPMGRETYHQDEIDHFFIIDRDLNAYLIPLATVIGKHTIMLSAYQAFRIATCGGWLGTPPPTDPASP